MEPRGPGYLYPSSFIFAAVSRRKTPTINGSHHIENPRGRTVFSYPLRLEKKSWNFLWSWHYRSRLNGIKLLEITALISSPTQRSMRFLTQRIPLDRGSHSQSNSQVHTTLLWNGKNQAQEFVSPGTYRYEVRAKLMAEQGNRLQARVVTRRSRGTIEVTALRVNEPPPESQEIKQIPVAPIERRVLSNRMKRFSTRPGRLLTMKWRCCRMSRQRTPCRRQENPEKSLRRKKFNYSPRRLIR